MSSPVTLRPYQPEDRSAVLAVFQSNVPEFFKAEEEEGLAWTLDGPDGPHWVVESAGSIIGYGGFEIGEMYNRVTLTWGMIARAHHGKGLGRRLLAHRAAKALVAAPGTAHLVVDTTPAVAGFYRRCGFEEVESWPGGYRSGFDMVVLRMSFQSAEMASLIESVPG